MNILIIYLGIFAGVLVLAFFLKLIKGVVKTIFFLSFVLLLIIGVLGFLIVDDAKEFQENFPTQPKSFLLLKEEVMVAGFQFVGLDGEDVKFHDKKLLEEFTNAYNRNNLSEVLADNYKLFIFNYSQFSDILAKGVVYDGFLLNQSLADNLFSSNNSRQVLADALELPVGIINSEFSSDEDVKGAYFAILIFDKMGKDPQFILKNLKNEDIEVFPETIIIQTIKFTPQVLYEEALMVVNNET